LWKQTCRLLDKFRKFSRFGKDTRMKLKYQTVDTRTLDGIKKAEKLKANGWKIGSVGFTTIQFYKEVKS